MTTDTTDTTDTPGTADAMAPHTSATNRSTSATAPRQPRRRPPKLGPRTRTSLVGVAVAGVIAVVIIVVTSVVSGAGRTATSPEDRFCGMLREEFPLEALGEAIRTRDERRITEQLALFRRLEDAAPAEIYEDFRLLVDLSTDIVRVVTGAPGPDGERLPVDSDQLSGYLAQIAIPAQNVAAYADRSCGLQLNS